MRNMFVGLTAIVVSVGVMAAAAQGRGFSGTWVVDLEKTMAAMAASGGGGQGGAVMARGGGGVVGGIAVAGAGGGGGRGRGGAVAGGGGVIARGGTATSDTVISLDATTLSIEAGGVKTSYPVNGTDVAVSVRGITGHARAAWEGDTLVITTTLDGPNGPVTSVARWSMEGESLVRETVRKTYYKRK